MPVAPTSSASPGRPGVGKSTTTNALVTAHRAAGHRVGVLAVDPSSPFSGGALLGDRIRMSGPRGGPGGLHPLDGLARPPRWALVGGAPGAAGARRGRAATSCCSRRSGSGQSEVEVAGTADTTLVLLAPGMGDGIQAAKAGILEVADVLVVNKADREGADRTVRDLRHAAALGDGRRARRRGGCRWCARWPPRARGRRPPRRGRGAPGVARRRRAARAPGAPGRARGRGAGPGGAAGAGRRAARRQPARVARRRRGRGPHRPVCRGRPARAARST